MQRFVLSFKSKAQNLADLAGIVKHSNILPLFTLTKAQIKGNIDKQTLDEISEKIAKLDSEKLIIRSSSTKEDGMNISNAGAFLSIGNIDSNNMPKIIESLQSVADTLPHDTDLILVQPYLTDIKLCGVAFSVDKDNFAPYFCIQYDTSGSNSSITDGNSKNATTYFHYRFSKMRPKDEYMRMIIDMVIELENLYSLHHLDVEFAIANHRGKEALYCLQVRPIVMNKNKINLYNFLPSNALDRLYNRFTKICEPKPHIIGDKAIFGVMPDWNPAEIIGLRPKRLALSLYKEIITDEIWAYQRDNYGYRNLRSHPLLHSLLGMPYIDVRASFNSFIPKKLDKRIATKLCNYYLNSLANTPELHDKVEFRILFSCYDFNIANKLKTLLDHGFNENEIKRLEFCLLELTNNVINPQSGLYLKDIARTDKLIKYFEQIKKADYSLIDKIYWLIEECKRYGTLPFAGVARACFIAMSMLNSLVEIGFFTKEERDAFLQSLNTISKKLSIETQRLNKKTKPKFLRDFGHLRAGSYDILSPRYYEAFDMYFNEKRTQTHHTKYDFTISANKLKALDELLIENGLEIDANGFLDFLQKAIEGREYVKFQFSKVLSYVLVLIEKLGNHYGISKEDMAHLDISQILPLYSSVYSDSPRDRIFEAIQNYKDEYKLTLALKLPPLITDANQIYGFYTQKIMPNFITQRSITAHVALEWDVALNGKIVCIYAADPGYDYLFSKDIAGLITCYGGANSHMAIRASELGLPAVIGVGEESFRKYSEAKILRIECETEQIFVIS